MKIKLLIILLSLTGCSASIDGTSEESYNKSIDVLLSKQDDSSFLESVRFVNDNTQSDEKRALLNEKTLLDVQALAHEINGKHLDRKITSLESVLSALNGVDAELKKVTLSPVKSPLGDNCAGMLITNNSQYIFNALQIRAIINLKEEGKLLPFEVSGDFTPHGNDHAPFMEVGPKSVFGDTPTVGNSNVCILGDESISMMDGMSVDLTQAFTSVQIRPTGLTVGRVTGSKNTILIDTPSRLERAVNMYSSKITALKQQRAQNSFQSIAMTRMESTFSDALWFVTLAP